MAMDNLLLLICVCCTPVVITGGGGHPDKMALIKEYLFDDKVPPHLDTTGHGSDEKRVFPGDKKTEDGFADRKRVFPGQKTPPDKFEEKRLESGHENRRFTEPDSDDDDGRLDMNDDMVLHVHARRRKDTTYGQSPDIPALTDTTFPAIVHDAHNILRVVLFYTPFDAVSMLFLDPYQQAGRELAARRGGDSSSSSHPLARVNCYDWPDVCRKENITTYPVIHLYQHGKWRQQYRHALDKDVLVRTVILLQWQQPVHLKIENEVEDFLSGDLPDMAHDVLDNFVLLKPSASLKEMEAFTAVVRQMETHMLFAVVSPDVRTHFGPEVGVLHVRWRDKFQSSDTLTRDLQDPDAIQRFLTSGQFHLLPELTFLNFPELYGRGGPLGVLFYRPSHPDVFLHKQAVADVIQSRHVHSVTFCMMGVEKKNPMAERILVTYVGRIMLPTFVIVDHRQGKVYALFRETLTDTVLLPWILEVEAGNIPPTNYLSKGEWKPVGRHYDYLAMMDRDRRREEEGNSEETPKKDRKTNDDDHDETDLASAHVNIGLSQNQNQNQWHSMKRDEHYKNQNEPHHNRHHQNQHYENQNNHPDQYTHYQNRHNEKLNNHPDQYTHHQYQHNKNQNENDHNQDQHHPDQNKDRHNQQFQNQDKDEAPANQQVPEIRISQRHLHPDHSKRRIEQPPEPGGETDGFRRLPVERTETEDERRDRRKGREDWGRHHEL